MTTSEHLPQGVFCKESRSLLGEDNYSDPLVVTNPVYGDVLSSTGTCPTGPPNNNPDISDALGVLNTFSHDPCAAKKTRSDLGPATPDLKVGITDVVQALNGFAGMPYPFDAPDPCAGGVTSR